MNIQEALIRSILSSVIVDEKKIPRKYYNKVIPLVQSVDRVSSRLDGLDLNRPQTWVRSALSMLQGMVIDEKQKIKLDPIALFLDKEDFNYSAHECFDIILDNFITKFKTDLVLKTSSQSLHKVDLDGGIFFYVVVEQPTDSAPSDDEKSKSKTDSSSNELIFEAFFPNDDDKRVKIEQALGDMYWSDKKIVFMDRADDRIYFENHKLTGREYKGITLKSMIDLDNFRKKNIRRVVVLQGVPGTGKSTLCENVAEKIAERIIFVSNSIISTIDRNSWETIIGSLRPNLVIIDDIDRVNKQRLEQSLHMFEDSTYNVPLTIMTTNDKNKLPEAFRRAGRVDMIFEMPKPDIEIRREMLNSFAKTMGIDEVPKSHEDFLINIMDEFSGAYIKELMHRYNANGFDYRIPDNDMVFGPFQSRLDNILAGKEPGDEKESLTQRLMKALPTQNYVDDELGEDEFDDYYED